MDIKRMFREGIVRVYDNRLSEAPSRTPQQRWVESRLDRILQKRRDLARCVTLCHVVLHIARALHLHRTPKTTCLWSKQITMCVLPHLDYTTATIARKCSDPFWHETACDNAATAFDWVRTSPGLEMSEETLNYGDKACLKLSRYVMICHD